MICARQRRAATCLIEIVGRQIHHIGAGGYSLARAIPKIHTAASSGRRILGSHRVASWWTTFCQTLWFQSRRLKGLNTPPSSIPPSA